MNWFNKAIPDTKGYFVIVDPETYYEWEYQGFVPQNTKVSFGNMRGTKSFDKTVISISCDDSSIAKDESGFFISSNMPVGNLKFVSGSPKSKEEIFERYKQECSSFSRKLAMFKQNISNRSFAFKKTEDDISLIMVKLQKDGNPLLEDYGSWKEMLTKLSEIRKQSLYSKEQTHKAKDLITWNKINASLLNVSRLPDISSNDVMYILDTLKIKPKISYSTNWEDFFENCDPNASEIKGNITKMGKLEWLKKKASTM